MFALVIATALATQAWDASFTGPLLEGASGGATGLARSGDTLVVTAPFGGSMGRVIEYRRSALGWQEVGLVSGATGASVALDGDLLVVGGGGEPLSIFRRVTETGPFELEVGPVNAVLDSAVHGDRVALFLWTWQTGSQLAVLRRTAQGWVADSTVTVNIGRPRDLDVSMDDARLAIAVADRNVIRDRYVLFFRDEGTRFESEPRLQLAPGAQVGGVALDGDRLAVGDPTGQAIETFARVGSIWHAAEGVRPYRAATLPVGLRFKTLRWSEDDLVASTHEGIVRAGRTASGGWVIRWIDRGPLGNSNNYVAFDADVEGAFVAQDGRVFVFDDQPPIAWMSSSCLGGSIRLRYQGSLSLAANDFEFVLGALPTAPAHLGVGLTRAPFPAAPGSWCIGAPALRWVISPTSTGSERISFDPRTIGVLAGEEFQAQVVSVFALGVWTSYGLRFHFGP